MVEMSKFKDLYISETEENIKLLNDNLILLEKIIFSEKNEETSKLCNDLMRASHTIKGSSASMGYLKTAYLTHVMEDVFAGARDKTLQVNQEIINLVFKLIDDLSRSLTAIKKNNEEVDFSDDVDKLKKITGVNTIGVGKSDKEKINVKKNSQENKNEVKKDSQIPPVKSDSSDPNKEIEEVRLEEAIAKLEYIKVPVERLDILLDLVEELLIDRMKLEQLSQKSPDLKTVYEHLNLIISSIQYQIMESRLVPVDQIYSRFPRMIRDLGMKLGKKIEFSTSGGDIELDRAIVDKLGEPLVHLLRNAADHGVREEGEISLRAYRESNFIYITVENDGNRIDLDRIKAVALEKGIMSQEKIANLSGEEIVELIFNSRLSTKKEVTEISGRGVGLSVVSNFAETLGGKVMVENLENGTRFILKLPLTLAIINSLLVETGGEIFAIPFSNIERSVLVAKGDIKKMADSEVAVVDGEKVPLVRIRDIFSLKRENKPFDDDYLTVVLTKKEDELIGVVVDSLLSEQEIIVKPLSSILKKTKGFSGSTILGNGRVALILDIMNLLNNN